MTAIVLVFTITNPLADNISSRLGRQLILFVFIDILCLRCILLCTYDNYNSLFITPNNYEMAFGRFNVSMITLKCVFTYCYRYAKLVSDPHIYVISDIRSHQREKDLEGFHRMKATRHLAISRGEA